MSSTPEITKAMRKLVCLPANAMLKLSRANYTQHQLKEAQQAPHCSFESVSSTKIRTQLHSISHTCTPLPSPSQPECPDAVLSIGSENSEGITKTFLLLHPVHKTVLPDSSNYSALFLAEEGDKEVDKEVLQIMEEENQSEANREFPIKSSAIIKPSLT